MKIYLAKVITILAGLAVVQSAMAMAVSDIELASALNQKLNAKIYLLSAGDGELSTLQVKLRQVESSEQGGVALQFRVVKDGERPSIIITSADVIREPFLNLELELNWSSGHLLRKYTLIIDPR
jgi:pilus assembly protein FimV